MSIAEAEQMVLFDEYIYEAPPPVQLNASESSDASGKALGLALILVAWVPIALLIWLLA